MLDQLKITDLSVGDVMTIDPVVIGVDDTIERAEDLMRQYRITGLPVIDGEESLVGVISQTDLLWGSGLHISVLLRKRPSGLRVGELMSSPPVTVRIGTSVVEAARRMRDERVHRVVVVDHGSHPLGVLSASDIVTLVAEE